MPPAAKKGDEEQKQGGKPSVDEKQKDGSSAAIDPNSDEARAAAAAAKKKADKEREERDEMSEEDRKLKEVRSHKERSLELLVTVITEATEAGKEKESEGVKQQALVQLRNHIRTSTSSMTSVPKPLKFLRPHYAQLKQEYERWPASSDSRWEFADILSVLAMTQPHARAAKDASSSAAADSGDASKSSEAKAESSGSDAAVPSSTASSASAAAEKTKDAHTERESLKYKLLAREGYLKSSAYKKAQAAKASASAAPAAAATAAAAGSSAAADGAAAPAAASSSSSSSAIGTEVGSVGSWGHEYVRNLAGEIGKEYSYREENEQSTEELEALVDEILPFFIEHNADFDAIDLLLEVEQLEKLSQYVNKDNVQRINMYMLRCSDYAATSEEKTALLELIFTNFLQTEQWSDALRLAIKLHSVSGCGSTDRIQSVMDSPAVVADPLLAKQLGFILGSQRIVPEGVRENEDVMEAVGNVHLSAYFQQLAADLDVKEAKTPEDIYKTHLEEGGHGRRGARQPAPGATTGVDSAKQNLASTFVNAFLNAGFGKDLLITPEGSDWLYKNKAYGMLSATASLGLLNLWDVESGFSAVDKYSFSAQTHIKAGAALAHGMLSSGITSDMDAAAALLSEHLESKDADLKLGAVFGLGLAYTGSSRDDVLELLMPLIVDGTQSIELVAHACLSLGLVYLGTANDDIAGSILEVLMERKSSDLDDPIARFICLGIGLLFLGTNEACEGILLALAAVEHPLKAYLLLTVETCAYAGSTSVLQIQKLLGQLSEHISPDDEEKEPTKLTGLHQEVAVLGIAMVALGEELAQEMALRSLDHVLQYGEVNVRRVVPLALGLLSLSNPRLTIMDTLSKLSHDQDERVSQHAIFAMGLIGAGTNNSRLATILRQLATYYSKEPNHLFLVRLAQGLLHLGKGLLTLSPMHSDSLLLNKTSLAGLLVVLHASMDMKSTLLSAKRHYLLFALTPAIRPRWLITLDGDSAKDGGELKPIAIPVRVGSRVDTVGQAGRPKTITGFQTHKTPVLLTATDRAELASEEYIALTKTLEGIVIVKKNPNYKKIE